MTLAVPDIDSTCNVGGTVIDYLSMSPCMVPLTISVSADLEIPWGPHCAINLHVMAKLRAVQCRRLVVPKPLPIEEFIAAGGSVHDSELWASSLAWADKRLKGESAAGILGASPVMPQVSCLPASAADSPLGLSGDSYHTTAPDDDPDLKHTRMLLGAKCSLISLATEYYVCIKSGITESCIGGYVGRRQYPR